jgi:putative transposase
MPAPTPRRNWPSSTAPSHVRLLVNFPPKVALSKMVKSLKGVSTRRMRQEFPDLGRH